MKIWVTKYALTEGIIEHEAEVTGEFPGMATVDSGGYRQPFHGNDWHDSLEGALERAEEMRVKKLASLEKSIKKMQALEFKVVDKTSKSGHDNRSNL